MVLELCPNSWNEVPCYETDTDRYDTFFVRCNLYGFGK